MAYTLWHRCLKVNPLDPQWSDRDRFRLSPGHGRSAEFQPCRLGSFGPARGAEKCVREGVS